VNNYNDIVSLMRTCPIIAREADFDKSKPCPYVAFFRSNEIPVGADGHAVFTRIQMALELYTKRGDTASEATLEDWLRGNDIFFEKTERVFVESESYYETVYEFELVQL
jgi:hypothetical protein